MAKVMLRRAQLQGEPPYQMLYHWCPACESLHGISIRGDGGKRPNWEWNGDLDKPTCTPSVLNFTTYSDEDGPDDKPVELPNGERRTLCHYFITNGQLVFCGDNPHALNGQTVDLPEIPPSYFGGETQD